MKRLCAWWEEIADWWKAQKVEWYAAYGTVIYIGIIILVIAAKLEELFELKLNELGDFLAGVFGPVAFLWLVLGFLQQGRELKLSSDALRLQADELKNSVEQQSIMAAAAIKQIESQSLAFDLQLQERERAMSALFSFDFIEDPDGRFPSMAHLKMTNYGGWANHVYLQFLPGIGGTGESYYPFFRPEQSRNISVYFENVEPGHKIGQCRVRYIGLDKVARSALFSYEAVPERRWIFVKTPNENNHDL
ncbi:hypothetical protein [Pseudomonas siliginis]|uniref:hypothetical protein n=1 Tax=Pseudomonas siliginis TaxID=2842346 RepID=UPI0020937CDA|nr:hypothetical protein [Pseudomonas siliginis]UST97310.1 hypothetical protein NF679_09475 [Pseudomonas siliginis]